MYPVTMHNSMQSLRNHQSKIADYKAFILQFFDQLHEKIYYSPKMANMVNNSNDCH